MRKEIIIGFLVALIATIFGFYLYVVFLSPYELEETIKVIREGKLWGKVLGLATIPNLFVFFIYLKKKQDYRARGVLLASFIVAFIILILQFF